MQNPTILWKNQNEVLQLPFHHQINYFASFIFCMKFNRLTHEKTKISIHIGVHNIYFNIQLSGKRWKKLIFLFQNIQKIWTLTRNNSYIWRKMFKWNFCGYFITAIKMKCVDRRGGGLELLSKIKLAVISLWIIWTLQVACKIREKY